jgi:DNA-binding transcriptional ArsR family regulator
METAGVAKYADMFAALGAEPRLQIVRLLLSAHPDGLIVSDIQSELQIPNSTLSHHLEKLRMPMHFRICSGFFTLNAVLAAV